MKIRSLLKQAYDEVEVPRLFVLACAVGILLSILFPTDLNSYRNPPPPPAGAVSQFVNEYGRFLNTAVQAALPFVKRDPVGVAQVIYVALATTAGTHGLKFLVDDLTIWDARIGERPRGGRHNMPSGHSSMASCAVWFVGRRYGWWHALYMIPITLLTMFARVELSAHTMAAVIAGALIGLLAAALFTGRRRAKAPATAADAAAAPV